MSFRSHHTAVSQPKKKCSCRSCQNQMRRTCPQSSIHLNRKWYTTHRSIPWWVRTPSLPSIVQTHKKMKSLKKRVLYQTMMNRMSQSLFQRILLQKTTCYKFRQPARRNARLTISAECVLSAQHAGLCTLLLRHVRQMARSTCAARMVQLSSTIQDRGLVR